MLEGLMLAIGYEMWLKDLEQELQPAYLRGKEECVNCGFCCARRPCIPTPDELEAIAKFLNMELKEAVSTYFVGDKMGDVEYIFPAKHTQKDVVGIFLDWRRTYDEGYCIFFDESKRICTIQAVKPASARDYKCWEDTDTSGPALESWKGVDIDDYIDRWGS